MACNCCGVQPAGQCHGVVGSRSKLTVAPGAQPVTVPRRFAVGTQHGHGGMDTLRVLSGQPVGLTMRRPMDAEPVTEATGNVIDELPLLKLPVGICATPFTSPASSTVQGEGTPLTSKLMVTEAVPLAVHGPTVTLVMVTVTGQQLVEMGSEMAGQPSIITLPVVQLTHSSFAVKLPMA